MPPTPSPLRELLDGLIEGEAPDVPVRGLADDSRRATAGDLFLARVGPRSDGRDHIAAAVARGVAAVAIEAPARPGDVEAAGGTPTVEVEGLSGLVSEIAERFHGRPGRDLALVGVTGTNGKTTVAHLTAALLRSAGVPTAVIGTLGAEIGGEREATGLTTPGGIELSRLLARAREAGDRAAVIETSSHALEQGRTGALRFGIGIFTNLSRDHLDDHGTMEAYAAAKARLFEGLGPDALAIVNADDPWSRRMLRGARCRALRCSERAGDASVRVHSSGLGGLDLTLKGPWGTAGATPRLIGRFHAMNALQALAAAAETLRRLGERLDVPRLAASLSALTGARGRMEAVGAGGPAVFVDYAHTPAALEAALSALRAVTPAGGRLVCVFGCGGDRDRGKRPEMGELASRLADVAILTSDNPRTEHPLAILDEARAGMRGPAEAFCVPDRAEAIRFAVGGAGERDVVLIAGKGHETEQILPDGAGGVRRIPFDDREHARAALACRAGACA